ncbi:cytochrome c-type biogenesis protein CcmH [Thermosporothrix hazakensis]|jgi:cytochrome c-type biogenesis protein CcmH|uniref:Cytochrome c-type biogenesis protein n=1 Tax=Thermosporothrix hazakensis TaxID=644383 RepID=A0A326U0H9_THEHA|nr:cytochrome c-type biogenesis protein CcmH [Thermosporothrix hazakensis]PZW23932.1 cytochrome c-type biogenesis protein CcmH [Thermosporothrix hazakensis]GCE48469.1 hypothetical protein KTH_33380 [Thermosporothrix hazakensis]
MKQVSRRQGRGWLLLTAGGLVLIAAVWSFLWFRAASNQTLDERVQAVSSQIKCPVCQGESIAQSTTDLARQMRATVREQLAAGKSEQEVLTYFQEHYGSDIVWAPQWQGFSLLAWLVPLALLLGGLALVFATLRDWRAVARETTGGNEQPVSEELEPYRSLLEEELAEEDILFRSPAQSKKQGKASGMEAK